jgi:hypothetical protein
MAAGPPGGPNRAIADLPFNSIWPAAGGQWRAKGVQALSGADGFGPGYEGAVDHQAELTGGGLRMTLAGTLRFGDERTKPMAFTVDFAPTAPRPADVARNGEAEGEPVPQRVHAIDVAVVNDVSGRYTLSKWALTSGDAAMSALYREGRLLPFGTSCDAPGVCYLDIVHSKFASEGERWSALVCGPSTSSGTYCRDAADSRKFKEIFPDKKTTALTPLVHDNFFQLTGPILTGSAEHNAAWSPGEPAKIVSWTEIQVEFKDNRVTGTVSIRQVPDAQT